MTKDPNYPAMKFHPQTGESRVFHTAEDVPEGWLNKHPAHVDDTKPAPAQKSATLPMTRDEIKAALDAGEIAYKKNAGDKALYDLLVASLKTHLTEAGIQFPEDADGPALLALVPPAE